MNLYLFIFVLYSFICIYIYIFHFMFCIYIFIYIYIFVYMFILYTYILFYIYCYFYVLKRCALKNAAGSCFWICLTPSRSKVRAGIRLSYYRRLICINVDYRHFYIFVYRLLYFYISSILVS